MKSDKDSFCTLLALLIGDCIERELRKPKGNIDLELLLMCDLLLEIIYPSELSEEEVFKRIRALKARITQEQ